MGPHRKRQRLSEDGNAVAVTSADDSHDLSANLASDPQASHADTTQNLKHRRQLFVRGLGTTVTTDDLTDHFSQSFPIKHAVAVLDKDTKQCKGFGFVTFADPEDAERARDEFDGSELQGRKIKVEIAEMRHRDPEHGVSQPSKVALEAKQRKQEQMQPSQSKLIIRNLPWSIKTEEQLTKLFLSFGKVKKAILPKKSSGMLAGYGFVTLRGKKAAEKALEAVNGKEIDGRTLAVDWSVEKETWQKVQKEAEDEDEDEESKSSAENEDEDEEADEDENDDDEEDSDENDEESDEDEERYIDEEEEVQKPRATNFYSNSTLFIRNLPFTCTDEDLEEHFEQFGVVRYARIVVDRATEKPKGTGFVCFFNEDDAIGCLKEAPRQQPQNPKDKSASMVPHSVLQNTEADPTRRYSLEGRVLNITKAVDRSEAEKLTAEGVAHRYKRDNDKRKLYLLSEGTIASNSPMYKLLSPAEIQLREASLKQRKQLIESNPSLHMSLTRLSIRNIPRTVSSKDLKQLARQAIVGFAKDMKEGKRSPLSQEELRRGDAEMREADKERKKKGKGVVRQAKIVFENKDGSKVSENSGAGRSRGYGFIEYFNHRHALMGLRWLNGHAIDYKALETQKGNKLTPEDIKDRKKRLIVEFAIENAQVVQRRRELETKMLEKTQKKATEDGCESEDGEGEKTPKKGGKGGKFQKSGAKGAGKRKRGQDDNEESPRKKDTKSAAPKDEKLAKQQRIIARKRQMRRARNKGTKR